MTSEPNPYQSPKADVGVQPARRRPSPSKTYSPLYKAALVTGLKIQAVLGILSALVLDGGKTFRWFWAAMLCQYIALLLIIRSRPRSPTGVDLMMVRYGIALFFLCLVAVQLLAL